MSSLYQNLNIIIVTYKSELIIEKTIKKLKSFRIFLVENSNNLKFKKKIEKDYKNVRCILTGSNLGYGSAINLAIKKINSKYLLILNPDCFLTTTTIESLYDELERNREISVLAPLTIDKNNLQNRRYGYFTSSFFKNFYEDNKLKQVDFISGHVFMIKREIFKTVGFFDKNFFLNYEEIDLFKRISKFGYKIFVHKKYKAKHLEGKSSSVDKKNNKKFLEEITKTSKWHLAWGKYYYYKKHYNFFVRHLICYSFLFKCIIQIIYFTLTKSNYKKKISKAFIDGMYNSIIGKKSFYRPKV